MLKRLLPKILLIATLILLIVATDYHPIQAQLNIMGVPAASSDFILSWSTDSYIPANYEGKALPTRGSEIRAAVETTKKISQDLDALYYNWFLDEQIAGYASGYGKTVFRFQASKWAGDAHEVKVKIFDQAQNALAENTLSIKIVEPQLLLTKQKDKYALTDILQTGTGQEIKFTAIPLFFHIKNLAEIAWQWTFAGQTLASSDEKDLNLLTLKIPQAKLSQLLEKSLSVEAINKKDQYQQASVNLNIEIK